MILDIFRKGKRGKARRNRSGRYVLPRVVGLIGFVCHFFFTRGASPILNSILLFLVELALTCFGLVLLPLFQPARGFAGLFNDRYTLKCKRTDARCVSAVLLIKTTTYFFAPALVLSPSLFLSRSLSISLPLSQLFPSSPFFFCCMSSLCRETFIGRLILAVYVR